MIRTPGVFMIKTINLWELSSFMLLIQNEADNLLIKRKRKKPTMQKMNLLRGRLVLHSMKILLTE